MTDQQRGDHFEARLATAIRTFADDNVRDFDPLLVAQSAIANRGWRPAWCGRQPGATRTVWALLLAGILIALAAAAVLVGSKVGPIEQPARPGALAVGTDQIWLVEPATRSVRALTPPGAHDSFPIWSPDGSEIAYVNHLGRDPVRVVTADGAGSRPITTRLGTSEPVTWSPDGRRLAFVGTGGFGLYVVNSDGTGVPSLATGMESVRRIAWSPDGRAIAFVAAGGPPRSVEGHHYVHVVDPDGGQVTRVSDSPVVNDDNGPLSWTPASEIAYSVRRTAHDWRPAIVLAAPTDSGWTEHLVTPTPKGNDLAVTSLGNGGRFAFINAAGRLTIVNRDGGGMRELARDAVWALTAPCVAPDGSAVAASPADGPGGVGGDDLFIVPVDARRPSVRVPVGQVSPYGQACSWQAVKR